MSKYKKNTFYIGNLVKNENGKEEISRENISLIYDELNDIFISFEESLNPSLDLLNPNISNEEKQKMERELENYKYQYTSNKNNSITYIDETSIREVSYSSDKKRGR